MFTATLDPVDQCIWLANSQKSLINGIILEFADGSGGKYPPNSDELYHPSTGTWTIARSMNNARNSNTTSVLTNGNVLVTDGANCIALKSTELY
ncbi:unnamed protein product [Rotaria sp. Silwood2]|nr:unnamed protein product [Rotaria sp. Silwood2]CAF3274098.1 unnamed protein product [Rotaria sp. Silwood2]CAF4551542.1 unnamed protein product [Rotaria sp. Silwood2]